MPHPWPGLSLKNGVHAFPSAEERGVAVVELLQFRDRDACMQGWA